jgi:hypothetical protein
MISWDKIREFSAAANRLADIEVKIGMLHQSRVKHARQLRSAIDRADMNEALQHYVAWTKAWYKIDKLRSELQQNAIKEAEKFPEENADKQALGCESSNGKTLSGLGPKEIS